ncbi:MAG: PDZ domain-containing protein, partial [Oscillibacter sp.]|nr:PDZ domain-containing protein [Oscillibacter sp.]
AAIERTVNDLLAFGELRPEPLLGLSVELEATRLDAEHSGLRVVEVTRGGAADRAGVRVGDFVLRADGRELRTSDDLLKVRRRHQVGETLSLTLWRDGETVTLTLDLRESVPEESGE